ncbi:hypothetical protein AN1580.2 [Aspergillus nidulans FGSC A4]|uniref:AAA+ ATPase domain-containing protein n=1 Tax=Emericella nidulans (strain FGSC A4 / ATCC 38163 / CBS 112.46 / NRRL 194 / M139) TaxID=227321 RepID=Q5BD00_EMENI|nr:hypothetical protein [Aspergillus nidulans FGSC A4]EAA64287.1 hypothetical protein AN1580.2 [Aspergillus nidulans FGSC A4]CBF85153.1 TPA: conserved hypothetical protein [Aspergillus nidulans FGSC A4]|eukprot:XP_659184.1 hypothetical protein AN1580.2 [Aspergillus nidulans FGSC A4]
MTSLTRDEYTFAWICALPLEMAAARAMLDKIHSPLPKQSADPNAYEVGELNGHYIVIACLPAGVYGTVSAATVVSRMRLTFPRLQYGLMVGIGGGVPGRNNDIRLGDVVVSKPVGKYSGVLQYDYGKAVQGGIFEPTGTLNKPPHAFLTHMGQLEAKQMTEGKAALSKIVREALEKNPEMTEKFAPPEHYTDRLFHSSYHHIPGEDTCERCDVKQLIKRQPRETRSPYVHYGLIASGDQVMKDSETRDRLARQHGILCFEMEAAGLMDELPTLVIRGICDYCDSHKQKQWQSYAALTAAAYAKLLLSIMPVCRTCRTESNASERNLLRHWMVSLERNPRFVGRQDELSQLEKLLTAPDGPKRVAITGLGGVGKTQLALEVAHRIRNQDRECSVFWVPCTSYAMIEQTFMNIAHMLGLHEVKPAEVKERVKLYLSSQRAGKWLLIFDNADDADMWLTTTPALEEILPKSEQGRILFTTRNGELAVELTSSNIIHIPDLDKKTAHDMLDRLVLQKNLLQDPVTTSSFLEQLAYFPLAISQASAYINKKRLRRYNDIQNPVITTWLISFKQIQQQDQLAADYLSFMACLDPRNIPSSLLPNQSTDKQKLDALGLLNAYSFTQCQGTQISMHRLVHIAIRNWLRKNGLFSLWIQRVADHLEKLFPNSSHHNRGLWRGYLPHALALVHENEFILQLGQYTELFERISGCLTRDGRYSEAEVLYSKLMTINQEKNSYEHPDTLRSMANLASTYWNQGRWNEAEKLGLQVLETRKAVLGPEHPDTLSSMANLASTYWNQGRWNEAEKLELQVLETSKAGRWNEAEKLGLQVLETRKAVLGPEHPDTLSSMANLASTYWNQGRWNEAEKLGLQVLETRKAVLGPEHPDTLSSMANLASTYWNQGRWNEAEKLELQVLETSKAVLGPEHPDTLTSMANLASTYRNQGRWNDAEKLDVQVLETRKAVLGPEHPDTLTSMANLASTYWNQGRWNEAEKLDVQVLETRKAVLGPEHLHTLSSMANLASTYWNQGRWNEAEKLEVQVLETRKAVLGPEHPDTLSSMHNLAYTYHSMGRNTEASDLMTQCATLRARNIGSTHPDTLSSSDALTEWQKLDHHRSSKPGKGRKLKALGRVLGFK